MPRGGAPAAYPTKEARPEPARQPFGTSGGTVLNGGLTLRECTAEPGRAGPPWSLGKVFDLLQHLWIPVLVVGTAGTAGLIRILRANLLDELKKPYVEAARADSPSSGW